MTGIKYSITRNRLEEGYKSGFTLTKADWLTVIPGTGVHALYLPAIDSAEKDALWGRVSFKKKAAEECVSYLYALALNDNTIGWGSDRISVDDFLQNPDVSEQEKKRFFEENQALKYVGQTDVLLYRLQGRYLYVMLRIVGEGECSIGDIQVDRVGDNFMNTFPEVYRERDSFFHRYLSIFSSIYNDFQEEVDSLPGLLDLDTCPRKLLPLYGQWLGIDISGNFLEEDQERTLVKEAYSLNRMKGTKEAVLRICKILLKEDVRIIEQSTVQEYATKEERQSGIYLFGQSSYDVTILVDSPISEKMRYQLMFLINQFSPVRSRIRIVGMGKQSILDSYSYLDMNARIFQQEEGVLDEDKKLDSHLILV